MTLIQFMKEPKPFLSDKENDKYFSYLERFFEKEREMEYWINKKKDKFKVLRKSSSICSNQIDIDFFEMKRKFFQDIQKYLEEELKSREGLELVERFIRTCEKGGDNS